VAILRRRRIEQFPTRHRHAAHRQAGRTQALRGLDLTAGEGVTGLLGPNGAGKTTLLRIVATVLAPTSGEVRVLGLDPGDPEQRLALRRRLGYLPQEPGFFRGFTAFEFVDYVAILKEMTDRRSRHDEVRRVLGLVGVDPASRKRIRHLSGGTKRRVALAQALLGDPDVVVLDEPTAGLDPEQRLRFRDLISRLGEERTVLLSTHQTEDVAALCRHVVVVSEGRAVWSGAPRDLADLARGRVWRSAARDDSAVLGWRTAEGEYRNLGDPPSGAVLLEPSIEDGYLLLLGRPALEEVA
jgi:ABC-2 type transport system ATP-binding protein